MRVIKATKNYWANASPEEKTGWKVGTALAGAKVRTVLLGTLGLYILYRNYRRYRSRQVLKNAIHDGTLPSIVEKIDIALVGAGTDEEKVYEAISDIPTQNLVNRVAELYLTAYEETLDEALRGDLDTDEMQTVKNIIAGKPVNRTGEVNYNLLDDWIRRLNLAKGTFSTDEDAIYRVLWEVPDRKGYTLLSNEITKNKSTIGYDDLAAYLNAQLGDTELSHAKEIMARKK